jgi:unsaturated chondroitin disaccharide hydrolase
MKIDDGLAPADLLPKIGRLWEVSAAKIDSIERSCPPGSASPVFTVEGQYTARGWTEWTQGFQYGSALLQFDATGDGRFLEIGRDATVRVMAGHISHIGVHDHGFNNVSTYGNLWRLTNEGRIPDTDRHFYELALKLTGAVQAARWRTTADGTGYIYSFNGPQSLFVDTIRSCRALAVSHLLGHVLMGEQDARISLLGRIIEHAANTARWNVFYGTGRDSYDLRGRTAHESIFNVNDGNFRCPSTQQGYSPFSTWTRGLAWAMLGYPEQLEFLTTVTDEELEPYGGRATVTDMMLAAATATADFYLEHTPSDGIPYWDTGAPGLAHLGDYLGRPADPYNMHEPVDSSAAAIGAQGLLRLGRYLTAAGQTDDGHRYWQAGLTVAGTLFDEPYLSTDPAHQGLILHSVYHRPNGWDHVPAGQRVPNGESSMWGDYHARELALYLQRVARDEPYYTFFGPVGEGSASGAAAAA